MATAGISLGRIHRVQNRALKTKWIASGCVALLLCGIGAWYLVGRMSGGSPADDLPPIRTSPYLNTSAEVTYVGTQRCAECHREQYRSYLETGHSDSFSEVDVATEPPDAQFDDEKSRRYYDVYRKEDELWHRESIRSSTGEELVLGEYPMRYAIGSGRHSRSYLVEIDGFLFESPATWYRFRPGWSLSPDYEHSNQGFERPASVGCLSCHVGRFDSVDGSHHRVNVLEHAIGCERCHGPGSLHAEKWSTQGGPSLAAGDAEARADMTIVHPRRLTREKQESICAQCHFSSAASAQVRGRKPADFRPGLRLADFVVHYGFEAAGTSMEVVGHVEQLRLSRCHQESERMTCISCHNPHETPKPDESLVYYRNQCLSCHSEQACGLTPPERLQENADDNCVACHMPRGPTDLIHFAFTHHRIGVHDAEQKYGPRKDIAPVVPLDDDSHLSALDRDRCRGLAYLNLAYGEVHLWGMARAEASEAYFARARAILEDVHRRGLRDPEVEAILAESYLSASRLRTVEHAESSLRSFENASPMGRVTALRALALASYDMGRIDRTTETLQRLVELRRDAEDWSLLAICRHRSGDAAGALEAALTAAKISPYRGDLQRMVAELYRETGDERSAAEHERTATLLVRPAPIESR